MNCDQALEAISAALDGELSAKERTLLDAHLADCPTCAALFDELAGQSRLLRQLAGTRRFDSPYPVPASGADHSRPPLLPPPLAALGHGCRLRGSGVLGRAGPSPPGKQSRQSGTDG